MMSNMNINTSRWLFTAVLGLVLGLVTSVGPAQAATYDLDESNVLNDEEYDSYLSVSIEEVGTGPETDIKFTIVILNPYSNPVQSAKGIQSFYFNVNGSANISKDDVTMITDGYTANAGKNNVSTFGGFNMGVKAINSSNLASTIVFTISAQGDSITDYWLGLGSVAHVIDFDDVIGAEGQIVNSGFFGGSHLVPIPAALPLFLSGIGILGLMGWRKRRT